VCGRLGDRRHILEPHPFEDGAFFFALALPSPSWIPQGMFLTGAKSIAVGGPLCCGENVSSGFVVNGGEFSVVPRFDSACRWLSLVVGRRRERKIDW
jgi:hypothetical protein